MKKDYLIINNLTKIYDYGNSYKVRALCDFSISINKGDFITIVGSNAAGKSTLFNLISGSILPTSGNIILDGESILKQPEFRRAKFVSYVKQNPNESVINSMTVAENLSMAKMRSKDSGLSKGVKNECKKEFFAMLESFGMGLEKKLDDKVFSLSGGQKQALVILMATIIKPKILLLDEHTAALDPNTSKIILKITDQIIRQNKLTTLMITHNVNQAIEYGNRLLILQKGSIKFEADRLKKATLSIMEIKNQLENSLNNSSPKNIFDKIVDFLNTENASYRVIEHEVVRSSQEESEKTGTNLSQGAKTLVMFGDGHPLMVVLSSIDKIEFKKLKKALRIKDLVMATPDQVKEVVGVEVGAVPPFGNLLNLPLYVDNHLAKEKEIIFGTGLFTKSIMMRYCDFEKVAKPMVGDYIIK